jgi:hypothetical protein
LGQSKLLLQQEALNVNVQDGELDVPLHWSCQGRKGGEDERGERGRREGGEERGRKGEEKERKERVEMGLGSYHCKRL